MTSKPFKLDDIISNATLKAAFNYDYLKDAMRDDLMSAYKAGWHGAANLLDKLGDELTAKEYASIIRAAIEDIK